VRRRLELRRWFATVRRVLSEVWNPVGAAGLPEDEYDAYVWPLVRLLREQAADDTILAHLRETERTYFDREADAAHLRVVLQALRSASIGSDEECE